MKLVFIIINKSPITLNWVINLAGKSNTAARAIPFPEGALRRKEAAGPLLPTRGRLCSLRRPALCCPSLRVTDGAQQLVAVQTETCLRPALVDTARV